MEKAICQLCGREYPEHLIQRVPELVLRVTSPDEPPERIEESCAVCWLEMSNVRAAIKGYAPRVSFKDPHQQALLEETQAIIRENLLCN